MAKANYYIGVITVKVKAPEGYRPRLSTYKIGYFSEHNTDKFRKDAMNKAANKVKDELSAANKGLELMVSASIEVTPVLAIENLMGKK